MTQTILKNTTVAKVAGCCPRVSQWGPILMLTLDLKIFTDQFTSVAACVPNRTTKDVLKNVLLSVQGETATLTATDGELHMQSTFACPPSKLMRTLIPAARVIQIVRELAQETIELEVSDGKVILKCGGSTFSLGVEDHTNFPPVTTFDDDSYFEIDGHAIRRAIKRTIFSTDVESTRYALGGIQIQLSGDSGLFISTDSRRLSICPCPCTRVNNPTCVDAVVHVKAMKLVESSTGEKVQMACRENSIAFRIGDVSISSQLVSGRFPDYKKVMPDQSTINRRVTLPVSAAATIVRQALVMSTVESRGIDLKFASDTLTVMTDATDIGSARASMPISLQGEPLTITLDGKYVAEFLKVLSGDASVEVALIAADDRVLITAGDYQHVIMPLSKGDK